MATDRDTITTTNGRLADAIGAARIMVVDDMPLMRRLIGETLEQAGFTHIDYAEDGDVALDRIGATRPDLVVLDIAMPRMDGLAVCRALRDDPAFADLPVVVQSAFGDADERSAVFAAGGTDFISKPINRAELVARVRMHVENRALIADLRDYRARMETELALARHMQHSLLPRSEQVRDMEQRLGARLESLYQASEALGGDLWGGWPLPDGRVALYVLDIAGHGVGAAMNTFRVHTAIANCAHLADRPDAFMTALDRALSRSFGEEQFATMLFLVLDGESGALDYVAAGTPPPIILAGDGARFLDGSGLPLGIAPETERPVRHDRLSPGESLFLYSDALMESPDRSGHMGDGAEIARRVAALMDAAEKEPVLPRLMTDIFGDDHLALDDDLTLLLLCR
ncbi:PP2C family protein-serine/threonine phosphatase [Yunchengibacter salinarum]|uniref:PP2C family protein-serine/threonine phosphatase n=1 Tax=Yunchengibacter salinarum TaxID=3133399 RepID=UPI0035B5D822